MAGDSSDNVPGIKGVGPKIAAELLETWGSLDAVLANAEQVKQKKRRENLIEHREEALLSRQLVTLARDVPLPETLPIALSAGSCQGDLQYERVMAFLDRNSFSTVKK